MTATRHLSYRCQRPRSGATEAREGGSLLGTLPTPNPGADHRIVVADQTTTPLFLLQSYKARPAAPKAEEQPKAEEEPKDAAPANPDTPPAAETDAAAAKTDDPPPASPSSEPELQRGAQDADAEMAEEREAMVRRRMMLEKARLELQRDAESRRNDDAQRRAESAGKAEDAERAARERAQVGTAGMLGLGERERVAFFHCLSACFAGRSGPDAARAGGIPG